MTRYRGRSRGRGVRGSRRGSIAHASSGESAKEVSDLYSNSVVSKAGSSHLERPLLYVKE